MSTETAVDRLEAGACAYHGITVKELRYRTTVGGEQLMHQYYVWAFPDGWQNWNDSIYI